MDERAYIEHLLQDARGMTAYARGNRKIDVRRLWSAMLAVRALQPADLSLKNASVAELQEAVADCSASIDPQVLLAISAGWDPLDNSLRRRAWIGVLVLVSLIAIAIVGQLTQIYNSGKLISSDLISLQRGNAVSRFGQLEREIFDAQRRLAVSSLETLSTSEGTSSIDVNAGPQAAAELDDDDERYVLAREAAHQGQDELVALDQSIRSLQKRAYAYQESAKYPVLGMRAAEQIGGHISDFVSGLFSDPLAGRELMKAAEENSNVDQSKLSELGIISSYEGHDPRSTIMRKVFCTNLDDTGKVAESIDQSGYLKEVGYTIGNQFGVMTAEVIGQNCKIGLYYYSGSVPEIASMEADVRDINTLYSFIILPAAYGALGALMYYMRRILDPLLPNPTLVKTLHRIALGALAGVLLAWLWGGIFDSNEEFKSIGLGLLALAFLFGFSIEVFFDLLDRLVLSAKRNVGKIGEPQQVTSGRPS